MKSLSSSQIAQEKKKLRQEIIAERTLINKEELDEVATAICKHIKSYLDRHQHQSIFIYAPLPFEIDILSFFSEANLGYHLALPRLKGAKHEMEFFSYIPKKTILVKNSWGIMEPPKIENGIALEPMTSSFLILIPCLGVDRQGYRLGFGGGYYDVYLSKYPNCKKMGIIASKYVFDRLPFDSFDQKLDGFFSEKETVLACVSF